MPTLESLYRQDPESLPFRMPVDPQLLCIPVCIPAQVELQMFTCMYFLFTCLIETVIVGPVFGVVPSHCKFLAGNPTTLDCYFWSFYHDVVSTHFD